MSLTNRKRNAKSPVLGLFVLVDGRAPPSAGGEVTFIQHQDTRNPPLVRGVSCGARTWIRTTDLHNVNVTL